MTKNNEVGWNLDNSYATLPQSFYTEIPPTPVSSPELVKLNHSLAISLGFNPEELKKKPKSLFSLVMHSQKVLIH